MIYGLWVFGLTQISRISRFLHAWWKISWMVLWAMAYVFKEKKSENSEPQRSPNFVWLRGWDLCEGAGFCPISNPLKSNL